VQPAPPPYCLLAPTTPPSSSSAAGSRIPPCATFTFKTTRACPSFQLKCWHTTQHPVFDCPPSRIHLATSAAYLPLLTFGFWAWEPASFVHKCWLGSSLRVTVKKSLCPSFLASFVPVDEASAVLRHVGEACFIVVTRGGATQGWTAFRYYLSLLILLHPFLAKCPFTLS
jgi:hypothetical protein